MPLLGALHQPRIPVSLRESVRARKTGIIPGAAINEIAIRESTKKTFSASAQPVYSNDEKALR
jgi:hypothetical protein